MNARAAHRLRTRSLIAIDIVLLAIVLAGLCWLVVRVWDAGRALQDAAGYARSVPDAVAAGDLGGAGIALVGFADAGADAAAVTGSPGWALAEAAPFVGADVRAIRVLAVQADSIGRATAPASEMLTAGGIGMDADALMRLGDIAADTAGALEDADTALATVNPDGLMPALGQAVTQFRDVVGQARPAATTAHAVAAFLTSLGATPDAQILVLLQNSAEARTGGGITGSFLLVRAAGTELELLAQADSGMFPDRTSPIAAIPASLDALYGDVVARFVQNASMPVDFGETARLATAWWQSIGHGAPDAVLSLDPLVLRAVLTLTGPVPLLDGSELTPDTVVQRLLVDPYLTQDAEAQTATLQAAAASIFERIAALDADPLTWVTALAGPIAEGRISLWTPDADAQRVIAASALGGPAARLAASGDDAFAIYFNDATGGKMDTFLDVRVDVTSQVCRADGRSDILIRLTMRSDAPQNAGDVLPGDMTGRGLFGTGAGDIGTSVSVAAPPGTFYGGVTKDGEPELSVDVEDAGRPTSLVRINLSPDEVNVVDFRFVSADPGDLTPTIVHTPLVNDIPVTVLPAEVLTPCA